ncbi:amidohydrolase family protein [Robbsia sp. KACC 23696]|uniref:amidohydrolase family protein n=1 Tax=Robbsia sp. KACC 23696 TaxID=3149231 RepID=UPI00325AAD43
MLKKWKRLDLGAPAAPCGCGLSHPHAHPEILSRAGVRRRDLLGAAAALGIGLAIGGDAWAEQKRAPGRIIDVHHHYTSPALLAMMLGRRTHQGFNEAWTVQKSLDAMDAAGVATAVVSTSDPGIFFGDYDQAKALARDCNEFQARMVSDYKGRFGMFVTLPLPDIDSTLAEIAYGLDTLKAQGVGMMTSYGNAYLGDPAFTPVMEELNRRRATVFVHPLQPSCCTNVVPNVPDVVVEYGTETSRTIASLLMNHTTLRYPNIRFIFSHGGGDVPYLTFRFSRMVSGDSALMKAEPGGAVALIQKLYFDTAQAWNAYSLPSLTALMPPERIVFGSDFPAASPRDTANGLRAFGLSATVLAKIEWQNAQAILPNLAG